MCVSAGMSSKSAVHMLLPTGPTTKRRSSENGCTLRQLGPSVCLCLCVCVRAHFQCRKWICGVAAVQSEWNNWLPIDPPLPLRTVLSTALLHRLIWSTACVHLYSVVCVCMHMTQHVCNPSGRKPQYKPAATIKAKKAWVTCDIWKMKSERERENKKMLNHTPTQTHTEVRKWGMKGSDSGGLRDSAGTQPLVKRLTQ